MQVVVSIVGGPLLADRLLAPVANIQKCVERTGS